MREREDDKEPPLGYARAASHRPAHRVIAIVNKKMYPLTSWCVYMKVRRKPRVYKHIVESKRTIQHPCHLSICLSVLFLCKFIIHFFHLMR